MILKIFFKACKADKKLSMRGNSKSFIYEITFFTFEKSKSNFDKLLKKVESVKGSRPFKVRTNVKQSKKEKIIIKIRFIILYLIPNEKQQQIMQA